MKSRESAWMSLSTAHAQVSQQFGEQQGVSGLQEALCSGKIPSQGRLAFPDGLDGKKSLFQKVWAFAIVKWGESRIRLNISEIDDEMILSWWWYFRPAMAKPLPPMSAGDDIVFAEVEIGRQDFAVWLASPTPLPQRKSRGKSGPKVPGGRDEEIKKRISAGNYPGAPGVNIPHKTFCDEIRSACGGWANNRERRPARGYSDRAILRALSNLRST
jgi:hypothetical protein